MIKSILFAASLLLLAACSSGERETKDLTNEKEENISPNQTQSVEEQAKKDSAATDIVGRDTAANKPAK